MSKFLSAPFELGNLQLPNNIFYAPLAGCSDYPFRQMSARYRPGLQYCEMVKMDALVRNDQGTFQMLDYAGGMHPIGAQLCGSSPKIAGQAARMVEEMGFDVIDLNCGCPVDKVTKDGGGSGLLRHPQLIGDLLANMVAAVKIPVTVKVRAGWSESEITAPEITEIAEAAGAVAITVHGRTRQQAYRGNANWDYIKECKQRAKEIKVIGNGDLFDAPSALAMFEYTGCDAVLVARGTMGQPWIAEDIIRLLSGLPAIERGFEDYKEALLEHFFHTMRYHPPRRVAIDMRRVGCWYFKKTSGTKAFREQMSRAYDPASVHQMILNLKPFVDGHESDQLLTEECCHG